MKEKFKKTPFAVLVGGLKEFLNNQTTKGLRAKVRTFIFVFILKESMKI